MTYYQDVMLTLTVYSEDKDSFLQTIITSTTLLSLLYYYYS